MEITYCMAPIKIKVKYSVLINQYYFQLNVWNGVKGKNIQGESKKSVIFGAWCKIVPFLCNSHEWCFSILFKNL